MHFVQNITFDLGDNDFVNIMLNMFVFVIYALQSKDFFLNYFSVYFIMMWINCNGLVSNGMELDYNMI